MDARQSGEPLLALARKDAAATVRNLPETVSVAVLTAGNPAALLIGWSSDHAAIAARLEEVEQSFASTDLRGALNQTRALLEGEPGEVLIYTDGVGPGVLEAASEELARLQDKGAILLPRVFAQLEPENLVPMDASYGDGLEGGTVTFTVASYGSKAQEATVSVQLPEGSPITTFLTIPASTEAGPGVAEGKITVPRQVKGGVASIQVMDSALPLDNAWYFHLPQIGASRVLVVDGEPGSTPTASEVYFLERALAPFGLSAAGGDVLVDVVAPSGIGALDPKRHRVAFVANVGDPVLVGPALTSFVREGGGLFLAMGENVVADRYNSALHGILPVELQAERALLSPDDKLGSPLISPDLNQPLLAPFTRAVDAFSRVRVLRAMGLASYSESQDVQTLLKSQDGLPLLVLGKAGAGRVVLWTSTVDLGWTNLPLQSMFVPFIQRICGWLGGDISGAASRLEGIVGEPLSLEQESGVEVLNPSGQVVPLYRGTPIQFTSLVPGPHRIKSTSNQTVAWAALNTPRSESDIRASTSLEQSVIEASPEQSTRKIPLWELFLAGTGLMLLTAAALSARTGDPYAV
jgi:uncharacterized membrane protein